MNLLLLATLGLPLLVVILYVGLSVTIGIRSSSFRALLLYLLAFVQGVHLQWVIEPDLAYHVLKSSGDKGNVIETMLSLPRWSPLISLESISGAQWHRMKANFSILTQVLQPISHLSTIFQSRSRELLESETVIDALKLNKLAVACFYEWVFERPFEDEKFSVVCQATWEWRKQLALKGYADKKVTRQTVLWCLDEIRRTPKLYDLFRNKWVEPEFYSLILQPFVISPAINLTDVAVALKEWVLVTPTNESITSEIIRQCICIAHPFPIVERYFPNGNAKIGIGPNTHILIPLDEMAGDAFAAGVDLSFGAGPRACVGRHMAMKAMTGLFTDEFVRSNKFQPKLNHKYSGRHNDGKETVMETLHQVLVAVEIVTAVAWTRLAKLCGQK